MSCSYFGHRHLLPLLFCLFMVPQYTLAAAPNGTPRPIPYLAANINQGEGSTAPQYLTVLDGELYFAADTGNETELWRYRPDSNMAFKLDVFPGVASSYPADLTPLGDSLYFTVLRNHPTHTQLWRYRPATNQLTQLLAGDLPHAVERYMLVVLGETLYFAARTGPNLHLWSYTPATASLAPVEAQIPRFGQMQAAGDALYFVTNEDEQEELWRYHPASGAAAPLATQAAGLSNISHLVGLQGNLYFYSMQNNQRRLWYYNPSTNQITGVPLEPANLPEDSHWLAAIGDDLYFITGLVPHGPIWRYSPSLQQQTPIQVQPGALVDIGCITPIGDELYFAASDTTAIRFWHYAPQADALAVVELGGLRPRPSISSETRPCVARIGSDLYFGAMVDTTRHLLRYRLGSAQPQAIPVNQGDLGSDPDQLTPVVGKLYFRARSSSEVGLWSYDPATGKHSAIVSKSHADDPHLDELTELDGRLYFRMMHAYDTELWSYDPDQEQLYKMNLAVDDSSDPHWLTVLDGELYFVAGRGELHGIWRYSPATGRAHQLASLPYPGNPGIKRMAEAGGSFFFLVEGIGSHELWRFDLVTHQAERVDTKTAGLTGIEASLAGIGDTLCFSGRTSEPVIEWQLWCYETGNGQFRRILGADSEPLTNAQNFTVAGDTLFFTIEGSNHRLYRYAAGAPTAEALDKETPLWPSYAPMVMHEGALYFGAASTDSKRELWRYRLAGEQLERIQIRPDIRSSDPGDLAVLDDVLYFAATGDELHGRELWALPLGENGMEVRLFVPAAR